MTLSALKGRGLVELQRELAALDPTPAAAKSNAESVVDSNDDNGRS